MCIFKQIQNMNSQDLSNVIGGLSFFVAVVTLILAYKIYDRFGVAGAFKAKEQELVMHFVGELYGFKLGLLLDNGSMSSAFSCDAIELYKRNLILREKVDAHVYLSQNLYDHFIALGKLTNHPYFPSTIADKCIIFSDSYRQVAKEQRDQNSFMFFAGEIHYQWDNTLFFQANYDGAFTVKGFISQLEGVLRAVESYYETNLPDHIPERLRYRYWNGHKL